MPDDESQEHPIVNILRKDRAKEDDQAIAVLKDYHTTITYLGAGALGFFLTIHEKFFQLPGSNLLYLFIISLTLLFLSLLAYLVAILFDYFSHSGLRDLMDDYIRKIDFDKVSQAEKDSKEEQLIKKWKKAEDLSRTLMFVRLGMVILGIAAEVIFIVSNLNMTDP